MPGREYGKLLWLLSSCAGNCSIRRGSPELLSFAAHIPSYARRAVGWAEVALSPKPNNRELGMLGFAALNPTYVEDSRRLG